MPRNKRVFPFFLDGGVQSITFDSNVTKSWNGTSSYIEVGNGATDTGTVSIGKVDSYGRPIPHGTMLLIRKVDASSIIFTVDWADEFTAGNGGTDAVLRNVRDGILLLFKGPSVANDKGEWVNLTADVSENNVYGALTVGGNFTANGGATFNGVQFYNKQGQYDLGNSGTPIAAAGTTAGTAADLGAINKPVYLVSSASGAAGIHLDAVPGNDTMITLINTSAVAMNIYPDGATRTTINGGASAVLAANAIVTVFYADGAVYMG
jgi:hypothetical protein